MTDKALETILNSLTILIDTREHEDGNQHITDLFDSKGIPYIQRCLKFGDYSAEFPAFPEHGIPEAVSFEKHFTVERKMSLTELSGNLAQNRQRFEDEFTRANQSGARIVLMVEDGDWQKIINHEYRTEMSPKSYIASLFSFMHRYGVEIQFIPAKLSGWLIYNLMKYHARELLKGG